jgi:hypothetical protein
MADDWTAGRRAPDGDDDVDRLRASFARLLPGATGDDVAVGNTVTGLPPAVTTAPRRYHV